MRLPHLGASTFAASVSILFAGCTVARNASVASLTTGARAVTMAMNVLEEDLSAERHFRILVTKGDDVWVISVDDGIHAMTPLVVVVDAEGRAIRSR
jgi:hypothetical protein